MDFKDIDLNNLKQLSTALLAFKINLEFKGYEDTTIQVQALQKASDKLSKLDNAIICIENELMASKGNLTRTYALQFALDEIRKVLK